MAHLQVTIDTDKLKYLFASDEGMAALAEEILNQVLEAQMTKHLQVKPYDWTEQRWAYCKNYKPWQLTTRVGTIILHVPQARDGSFSTDLFRHYQHVQKLLRSEQALATMEMVLQGVSMRQVTEELCGTGFSKSTVSWLCAALDLPVGVWNEHSLENQQYPFLVVDAMRIKVRRDEAVRSTSTLIAIGINEEGHREVLGLDIGDSESEATWKRLFKWLKAQGLRGVELITSDHHRGLVKTLRQKPRYLKVEMTSWLRRIFRSESQAEARGAFCELARELDGLSKRIEW